MKRKPKPGYATLLVLTILFTLGAGMTVLPAGSSYAQSMLGYEAHCPMAPVSTVGCLLLSALTCITRRRVFKGKVE